MSPRAQNIQMGPDALRTAENVLCSAKHEYGARRRRYRRKLVRERKTLKQEPTLFALPKTCLGTQNMKTGLDALGIAENESGSAKHEHRTRRLRYVKE
jgi:hypothetical protein